MIDTTYREFAITYDEQDNSWRCRELALTSVSLGALKGKIDARLAEERRLDPPVPVFVLGVGVVLTGKATMMESDKGDGVWVSYQEDGKTRRGKFAADRLVVCEQHNGKVLDQADALEKEATRLNAEARSLRGSLKRYSAGELRALGLKTKTE